jgi:4-hydroxy-tetrahydrodipicolinate reductase
VTGIAVNGAAATRIAVNGAAGRMGRSIIAVVLADAEAQLTAAIERKDHAALGSDAAILSGAGAAGDVALAADVDAALERAQVVIDFTTPESTCALLARCAEKRVPAVVGTTGMNAQSREAVQALARVAPVVFAANFSVGVNVLWALCERAVQLCGDEFDLEVVEMHHHHKVDAPSGTALKLAEVIARARGLEPAAVVNGRSGQVGARKSQEIGMHALRGGDVFGDHTLVLAGPGERIELTHRAGNREIFARGAVRAAHWVVGRPAGLYDMGDVLGLKA